MSLFRAYCRAFTFRRLANEARCLLSYILSRGKVRYFRHKPCFISVEPANYCQLSCPECYVGTHRRPVSERRLMHASVLIPLLAEVAPCVHTMQFYFQGEPTLNSQLPMFIGEAQKFRMVTIVSTNAQAISREMAYQLVSAGLSKIIVSMDGLTQSTYERYRRGGKVKCVLDALSWLSEAKAEFGSDIEIELQCLMLKTNQHEWEELRRRYRELGATRFVLKTVQISDERNFESLLPDDKSLSRYEQAADGSYRLHGKLRRRCLRLWRGCVVAADGNVLPCCFDKAEQYSFGRNTSLQEAWFSESAMAFRERVLTQREKIPICQNCTE